MNATAVRAMLLAMLLLMVAAVCQADWDTNRLNILLSATETKGGGDTNTTVSWNLSGNWDRTLWSKILEFSLDSDYSKSENAKLDRLRTGSRLLDGDYGKKLRHWYPVLLLQTEGNHGMDSINTLFAAGMRQKRRYGYFEATLGVSKDVRTAEPWVGDIGVEFGYERKFGDRWTVKTGPKGEYGAIGSVRLRDDRFRYSWDVNVDYKASDHLGIGYRLWYGNTVPDSDRTQYIGLSYTLK
jgi:hypothetical protein